MFGLSVILPLSLFAWTAWTSRAVELEDAERTAVRTVTALHEHAAKVFQTHQVVLDAVDRRIEGQRWEDIEGDLKLREDLHRFTSGLDQIKAIALVDSQGRVRVTTLPSLPATLSVADRDYFRAQVDRNAGTYVSEAYTSLSMQERVIALSKRRTTADGRFDGIIHVVVPVSYLTGFWEQFAPTIAHVIPLVRADGAVIARYPAADNPDRLNPKGPFLSRALQTPRGVYTAVSQVDGVERLNAYTKIKGYPLFISFSIETGAILANWYRSMALYGVYTLLAAAALIGATAMATRQYRVQLVASQRWQEVADRLAAEMEAREKVEAALRQSQKMEAVGQITGGIAHDFNNLLQAMTSNLYLLSAKVPADARMHVEAGKQAVERGSKLVRQLMAFARRQELKPQPVDLQSLLGGMDGLLQKAVGDGVRIEVEVARELGHILVDPTQMEMAILNLAINARDAMAGSGRITIAARNVAVSEGDVCELKPGSYVVLSIADTGSGMTPEVQARAFDPFFTTKDVGKGTGLGLSMVHGFANQSGGGVDLRSRIGQGTTVSLYLPQADVPPPAAFSMPGIAASASPTANSESILLVDDEAIGRMATAIALRGLGYQVLEARDGEEALGVLARESSVDLLVTDYAMPGMNGKALAAAARATCPSVKVILITGYAASMLDLEEVGVSAVLGKPFPVEALADRVRTVLEQRAANVIDFARLRRV